MSTDESQGDAAWRLLNALPVGHASTASLSSEGGSGSQSQLLLPSVEVPMVDAYRGFGLAGDSMDVDMDTEEQGPEQGGGTQNPDSVFKRPFLPVPAGGQPQPPPIVQAVASSSRAATQQPKSPIPIPKTRRAPSPEPESQDSFAQPTGSQEKKRFLRETRGRIAELMGQADATAGRGRASPESSQTQSSSSAGDRSRELPEPVVLVAGTPSQSQSQSQPEQHGQQQSQSQNPKQDEDDEDEDDEYTRGVGQDSQVLSSFALTLDPAALLDEIEHENPRSEDSFDARVQQQDEEEDENGLLIATQLALTQQETQPHGTAAPSTGLSEQAEQMLRNHPLRYQRLRHGLLATNTSNLTNVTHPSNLTNATHPSGSTHLTAETSAANRAFVRDGDVTQQDDFEGTPPPGPPIETQLQSPPRTAPRKRTIPSARSTQQRPATASASASAPSLPSPQTPHRVLPVPDVQQHSSPATNNMSNSNPSQAYSSSVVPGSVASEVSAPPMRRPPPLVFLSPSLRREQDDEVVPDSAPASSVETPSSQPVPLALVVARRREMEAANAMTGLAQGGKKGVAEEKAVPSLQQAGKENEISSLASDTSLGLKRQPVAKRRYGGRKGGEEQQQGQPMPPPNPSTLQADDEDEEMDVDGAPQTLPPSSLTRPQQRAASREAVPEPFPGEEDISVTSPSEGEHDPDPESQPPVKAGSPRRKRRTTAARRSPTVEADPPPVRRVVKGARRPVEPMISMEAFTEAESAPPTQQRPKKSVAATRVRPRRASAATALKNLKESDDDESGGDGGYEDESYRETQYQVPLRDTTPPVRATRKASGAKKTAPPSAPPTQTQTQPQTRNLKRRRASDGQTQTQGQGQRKRVKLEEKGAAAPTVYALYTDNKFYPAIVTGVAGNKYAVLYCDGAPGFVSLSGLRAGPAVDDILQLVDRKKLIARLLEFSDVDLRVSIGPDGDEETVSWTDVCRTKAMAGSVALTAEEVDALRKQDDEEQPASVQRIRTVSPYAAKHSPSELFKGLAFVLTCLPSSNDRAWRTKLPKAIENAEGTVLQDWTDVMSFGPKPTDHGRWSAKAGDLVPLENADQRVITITDVAVMTPKYLMALALGLPCVSQQWAVDVLNGTADVDQWHSYLLIAGHATNLKLALSQVVECDADGNIPTVREALAEDGWAHIQRRRRRPFTGKSVLLVGEMLLPSDEMLFAGKRSLPPVCLAMGASEVEAVLDFAHASLIGARRFDVVVIQDNIQPLPSPSDIRARLAVNGLQGTPLWLKQCLIAGRLLDPSRV